MGAAIVEMALLAPFLILLALGAVEGGWLLMQSLDVAHAAREGGRAAAVNTSDTATIVSQACSFMDDDSNTTVSVSGSGGDLGAPVIVTVTKQATTLTGSLDTLFNPPVPITHIATFVLEQAPAIWSDASDQPCP